MIINKKTSLLSFEFSVFPTAPQQSANNNTMATSQQVEEKNMNTLTSPPVS
jgi:hypothetical protein